MTKSLSVRSQKESPFPVTRRGTWIFCISLKINCFEENTDGEPQLYLVHRLDRPVGGVMVFARTKKAAASLTEQIKDHTFEKDYQAVLTGWLPDDEGTFRIIY